MTPMYRAWHSHEIGKLGFRHSYISNLSTCPGKEKERFTQSHQFDGLSCLWNDVQRRTKQESLRNLQRVAAVWISLYVCFAKPALLGWPHQAAIYNLVLLVLPKKSRCRSFTRCDLHLSCHQRMWAGTAVASCTGIATSSKGIVTGLLWG